MRTLEDRIERIGKLMSERIDRVDATGYDLRSTAWEKLNASHKRWLPIEAKLVMNLEFEEELKELYADADSAIAEVDKLLGGR